MNNRSEPPVGGSLSADPPMYEQCNRNKPCSREAQVYPILCKSRPLLNITLFIFAFEHPAEPREREAAAGEVDGDQPGADAVDEMMEQVGVGDAVDSRVDGEQEEEHVGYVAEAWEFMD